MRTAVRGIRWAAPLALATGSGLLADAVARGAASFYWVVIFPVIAGSSLELLGGALLLMAGFFLLPLTLLPIAEGRPRPVTFGRPAAAGSTGSGSAGGLLLVGPFPIFFGSWKGVSPAVVAAVATIGGMALVVAVLFALGWI